MIIEKIVIKSFGLITDMTLEFSKSVNVIEGQNESGKSTIAAFIKYMLYGFDESDADDACGERRRRLNWSTGMAQGSMYVRVGDKRYLINRSTVPTEGAASGAQTYKEESSIIDLDTGAPAFGKVLAGEVFFGVSRELFDNTAYITKLGDPSIDEDAVKESIENIIFSVSETINTQRAEAKIADKMQALMNDNGTAGAIVDIAARENELVRKFNASNSDNRRILEKESELHKIKQRRIDAEEALEGLRDLDSSYTNMKTVQSFDELHDKEEHLERCTQAYNEFVEKNTRCGFIPDEKYFIDLTIARKAVGEAYHSLGDAQDAYAEQRRAIGITKEIENAIKVADENGGEDSILKSALKEAKNKLKFLIGDIATALCVIAALVVLLAVPCASWIKIVVGIAGAIALGATGALTFFLIRSGKALSKLEELFGTENVEDLKGKIDIVKEARAKRDAMVIANESARAAVEKAKERYEASKRVLAELIMKWGEEPPASDLASFLDALEAKITMFLNEYDDVYSAKRDAEIAVKNLRDMLATKNEIEARALISPFKRKVLAGANHDDIMNGIENAKAAIDEEKRLALEVETELARLKGRSGDPGEYYSRIYALESRREDLQAKHKAYYMALDAISNASGNLRAEISPRLGEYATSLMGVMTDNKYTSFDISNGLTVSFVDAKGELKAVDFLSGGTKQLAYVAVRAALIDMLYKEKPPICFDETFAHQDNVRARSMMKAIKRLAEDGAQSFIFTCRGREAVIAADLIPDAGIYKLSVIEEEKDVK